MALTMRLKPGERLILGGVVVRNGEHRATLHVETKATVLRSPDIIRPRDVRTPCERIVFALQLLYIEPERADAHHRSYVKLARDVRDAAPSFGPQLAKIDALLLEGDPYRALKAGRPLLALERRLFDHVR
ncbi:MAG: flagellar biosynthesis repressor FlbT [Candidatus Eisenbacteria bacterium]